MFWEPFEFRLEDLVVESLVISFGVIMPGEFGNGFSQGRLAEENHVVQARFFNGPDKAFRKGVQVGRSDRKSDGFHASAFQYLPKLSRE